MPENEAAWEVWEKYGWTLIDWERPLFLISSALDVLTAMAVDDVEEELFKVAIIANVYIGQAAKKAQQQ